MSPKERIEKANGFLIELQQAVSKIIYCDPPSFNEGELGNCLKRFNTAYQQSLRCLKNPSLRISTIGTTSSGKSTLVNAIIGRRLAPIDADEMSAGVLSITHAEKSRLIVEKTENAVWKIGEWSALNDEEIYLKLRATKEENGYDGVMVSYHKEKKRRNGLESPRIRIEAPILPVLFPELLQLPSGIRFELLDLPGLKRLEDRQSLKVIQQQVKDTFSLVVMDYTQTDEVSRAALLEELKDVVTAMHGRTSTMIFLLNKINLRSRDDQKIEYRYGKLKEEIARQLGLDFSPDLLGIDARLLYYVQCAWGPDKKPVPPCDQRTKFLDDCMEDCATTFKQKKRGNAEVKEWINKNEDELADLTDDDLTKLFCWSHDWSGGKDFWNTFRQRIAQHFPELVIYPALRETLNAFNDFAGKTEEVARIRKIETKKTIEEERKRIDEELSQLLSQIENQKKGFFGLVKRVVETVVGNLNSADVQFRAIDILMEEKLIGLKELPETINNIREDLFFNVIIPVREAFKEGLVAYDLEDRLGGSLSQNDARHVAQSYAYYSHNFMKPEVAQNGLKLEIKKGDNEGEKKIKTASQQCQNLYQRMREGLSRRAEFLLQKESMTIEDAIINLLRSETKEISEMAKKCLSIYKESKIILPEFETIIRTNPIELPSNLFELPQPKEKSGYRRTYTTGTCFEETHTEWATSDEYGTVSYRILELPSADGMAEQWTTGINLAKNSLWDNLALWINSAFESTLNQYSEAIKHFQKFIKKECDNQIKFIEEQGKAEIEKWDEILERLKNAISIYNNLRKQANLQMREDS
jgi:GTPase SAR1 family protein